MTNIGLKDVLLVIVVASFQWQMTNISGKLDGITETNTALAVKVKGLESDQSHLKKVIEVIWGITRESPTALAGKLNDEEEEDYI